MNKKLTLPQIKRLAIPASGFQEYSAQSVPGLRIRVMASGIRSFVFRYKVSSKNNVITLGRVDVLDLKEAEQQAKTLRLQVDQGQDPAHDRRETKRVNGLRDRESELNPLFCDFIGGEFIPKHAKRHNKSWLETQRYFERDVLPTLGKLRVKEITRRDVARVLNAVQDRGALVASNRVRAAMSKSFTYAMQQGLIEANPVQFTVVMKERARDRVLTEDEIRFLWANSEGHISKLALRFALLSGQRAGEVAGLKWSDIKDGVWFLQDTKNGHSHTLPISAGMQGVLDSVRSLSGCKLEDTSNGFVFTSRRRGGSPIKPASLLAVMKSFAWGDSRPTVHDLRRTAATMISRLGHNRIVQDKVLNHVDSSVGGIYDRNDYTAEKLQALNELWDEVQRIVGLNVVKFPAIIITRATGV